MKFTLSLLLLVTILAGCRGNGLELDRSACEKPGTLQSDRVSAPTRGFDIAFQVYLPPCYDELEDTHFPVLYLIAVPLELQLSDTDNTPMSLAERLIRAGKIPPAILIVPEDTVAQGYHAALAIDLIPYVDEQYRTLPERRYRGVGGISHGAALAARMAFQFPETFGSLGVLSGGITNGERTTFNSWMAASKDPPRVLIYVGDQDGIMPYTQNLFEALEAHNVPYELNIEPGGHEWAFWSAHLEAYLLWFAEGWK
jgi:enterochelin esterase family protein